MQIEYFHNIWLEQGAAYSDGMAHDDRQDAADEINDYGEHLYLETIWRKEDGTCEVVDLSGLARDLALDDAAERVSSRQHDGLSRQVAAGG